MRGKTTWQGVVAGVQPHIVLVRSFDQRSHSYLGYVLRLNGTLAGENGEFLIAIGAQQNQAFRVGDPSAAVARLGLGSGQGLGE